MAEFMCLSRTCMAQIYSLVCTDCVLFFSFIFCNPLYLSYFVFFSPYLYKLVYFLSPLFVTISLFLLALIYDNFTPKLSEPGCSFLLSAFSAVFDILSSKVAEEFENFEDLEVYKIVFLLDETCSVDVIDSSEGEISEPECEEKYCLEDVDQVAETTEETKEMLHSTLGKKCAIFNKVLEVEEENSKPRIGSEAVNIENGKKYSGIVKLRVDSYDKIVKGKVTNEGLHALNFNKEGTKIGSYGSMRKEKEWKRTLACKLFEERHCNMVERDERMDSLWETYESDSTKPTRKDVNKKRMKKKSSGLECNGNADEDDDDEVEMTNGHLCCLQAFKFSARKMNMGMGKTNIVKISKALKGIGWLHNVKRHDKKEKS